MKEINKKNSSKEIKTKNRNVPFNGLFVNTSNLNIGPIAHIRAQIKQKQNKPIYTSPMDIVYSSMKKGHTPSFIKTYKQISNNPAFTPISTNFQYHLKNLEKNTKVPRHKMVGPIYKTPKEKKEERIAKATKLAFKAGGASAGIAASSVITTPLNNLYHCIGTSKDRGVVSAADYLWKKEGAAGFGKTFFSNTGRRIFSSALSLAYGNYLQKECGYSPLASTSATTGMETISSLIMGEIQNKRVMCRADTKMSWRNLVGAGGSITARNFGFNAAMLVASPFAKKLSSYLPDGYFDDNPAVSKEEFEKFADYSIKATILAVTTPADNMASRILSGNIDLEKPMTEVVAKIMKNPKSFMKGAGLRATMGVGVVASIEKGIEKADQLYQHYYGSKESGMSR